MRQPQPGDKLKMFACDGKTVRGIATILEISDQHIVVDAPLPGYRAGDIFQVISQA